MTRFGGRVREDDSRKDGTNHQATLAGLMNLIDLKMARAYSLEHGAWLQRISVVFTLSGDLKDQKQYDVTLKEPIAPDDLAKALDALATSFRESL